MLSEVTKIHNRQELPAHLFSLEPAIVHIELSNPLQVAITISNIILGCSYSDPTPTNGKNEEVDAYQVMPDCTNQKPNSNLFSFENFDLEKISEITLEPLETKTVFAICECSSH